MTNDLERSQKCSYLCADDVECTDPNFLISGLVIVGKGTMVQGDGGSGKTSLTMKLAAAVSAGESIAEYTVMKKGRVLIVSGEDDPSALATMLRQNGADMKNCYIITDTTGLSLDSPKMRELISELQPDLVVIDPLQAYLGANINMDKANQTRPVLDRFFKLLEENRCAAIIIAHTGKNRADKARVNQSLGSVDISAAMRVIISVEAPENGCGQRTATPVKCSYDKIGPTIVFEVGEKRRVEIVELRGDSASLAKRDPLYVTVVKLAMSDAGGGLYTYDEINEESRKLTGVPAGTLGVLRRKLDGSVGNLLRRDGIIVQHGVSVRANRSGISITRICGDNVEGGRA